MPTNTPLPAGATGAVPAAVEGPHSQELEIEYYGGEAWWIEEYIDSDKDAWWVEVEVEEEPLWWVEVC